MQIVGQTWLNLVTWTCGSWSEDQQDLYFTVQWFCLISWRLWCMYIILSEYESVRPDVWPQNKCRLLWPIFHGPLIVPYTLTISCMNIIIWDYESVCPDAWPQNKCWSLWPIFHGPVILPYLLKTIWCMYIILSEYESVRPNVWPRNVGHCDLYFMVQWLCLIPWRLFHVWTALFGIMNQYDLTHHFEIHVGHHLYITVQWFCLISWRLFDVGTSYFRSMN